MHHYVAHVDFQTMTRFKDFNVITNYLKLNIWPKTEHLNISFVFNGVANVPSIERLFILQFLFYQTAFFYYRTYSCIQIFIASKIKEISRYRLNRQCLNISIRESDSTTHHRRQIKPSSDLWSIPSTRADFIRRDAIIHAAGTRSPNSRSLISRIIFSPAHFVRDAIRGRRGTIARMEKN